MLSARLRRQDGFIREIFWLALVVAIVAVVLLDALSLFNAHQTGHDNAKAAAQAAREAYVQSSNAAQAKAAAQASLARSGDKLIAFSVGRDLESQQVFTVTAQNHAHTYVFGLLRYVGLKKWVTKMTDPTASESSN
jgi:multidrug efflux pump subunit AcrA (membrane-fusion protein)